MNELLNKKYEGLLCNVKKPYQYIGSEFLAYNKDFNNAKVKIALAFPDKYEIAISNLGQKILYEIINSNENYMADRVYAPDNDYREQLIKNNLKLRTLESKEEVNKFDFIGFSLQYELAYPTVLEMLRLSDIPIENKDRKEKDPIIIAGGPACFNPRPMQDFIDLFTIGDGEEVLIEIFQKYEELKNLNKSRQEIIKELSDIEGVFSSEYPKITKKRIFDISKDNRVQKSPIPYSSGVHDRTIIEIRRGCGRMCRFCQAGHVNLPIRERKAQNIIQMVKDSVKISGYDEYSLLSLSSNDYANIENVIEVLSPEMKQKRVSVSLPSQRIDRYSTKLAHLVRDVRATTATLAPEAGSQRLRNVINKNLSEEQIIDTILNCYKNGFNNIKLYFMIGLPTETYTDLDEMAELFGKIRYKSKLLKQEFELKDGLTLTCTLSIFVPKPFTPFQWCGQDSQSTTKEKIKYLLDKASKIKGVKINYHNSFTSKVECAMSRGDERYNKFILALHKKGVYLSTWDENVDKNLWEETAIECGFNIDEEAKRQYSPDEVLPWDIIDTGIDKEWLKNEYKKALNCENTVPCEFNCVKCGVCKNLNTHKITDKPFVIQSKIQEIEKETRTPVKYRLKISKTDEMKYISHLDWQNTLTKALYRSGLDLCFSQGFNPTPKFSLGIALPIFTESICELTDIDIYNELEPENLKEILNSVLPEKIRVLSAEKIDKTYPAIDVIAQWALYSFEPLNNTLLKNEDLLYIINEISSSNEIFIEKINKKGIKKLVNIKPSIKSAKIEENKLMLILKTGQSDEIPSVKPEDVIKLYKPEVDFRIIRLAFYDKDMNRL